MNETKLYLKKAFQTIPEDFSLREVRSAISLVFQKIEQYETKTVKRVEHKQELIRQEQIKKLDKNNFKIALEEIDKMISEEKKTIAEITAKKDIIKNEPRDDTQTFHG
jgi:hypothetical protein